MSYAEPHESGYTQLSCDLDPTHHAVVPADADQDLAFRSIRAISNDALRPVGKASHTPERRTPKGIRPMVWIRLNETRSAVVFEVTLHTNQLVLVNVPIDSWRYSTLDSEAVRAAVQKAYLNLLRRQPEPVIVKAGMKCMKLMSKNSSSGSKPTASRQTSYDTQYSSSSRNTHSSSRTQSSSKTYSPFPAAYGAKPAPYQIQYNGDPYAQIYINGKLARRA